MTDNPERALEIAIERANQPLGVVAGQLGNAVSAAGTCLAERQRLGLNMPVVNQRLIADIREKVDLLSAQHFGEAK